MAVEKIHESVSLNQSKWLETYISFNTQKINRAKMILRKTPLNYLLMLLFLNF